MDDLGFVLDTNLLNKGELPFIDYDFLARILLVGDVFITPYTALELHRASLLNKIKMPWWVQKTNIDVLGMETINVPRYKIDEVTASVIERYRFIALEELRKLFSNMCAIALLYAPDSLNLRLDYLSRIEQEFYNAINVDTAVVNPYQWSCVVRKDFLKFVVNGVHNLENHYGMKLSPPNAIWARLCSFPESISHSLADSQLNRFVIDPEIRWAIMAIGEIIQKNNGNAPRSLKLDIVDLLNAHATFDEKLNLVTLSGDRDLARFIYSHCTEEHKRRIMKKVWKEPLE